jgi:hypothetical protein
MAGSYANVFIFPELFYLLDVGIPIPTKQGALPQWGKYRAPLLERPTIRPKKFLTDPVSGQLSSPQGVVHVSLVIDEVSFHQHHISQLSGKQLPITSYEQ